jgi:Zn-dependent protease with chaperone function
VGLLLIVGGFALLVLPAVLRSVGRRLTPAEWSRLCATALVGGALTVEAGAILYAAPTVLRAVGVDALASACERMLGHFAPGGLWAGWASAVGALTIAALAGGGVIKSKRVQRLVWAEPEFGRHERFGDYELVTLPTGQPLAVSVEGPTPQILVSDGLIDTLPGAQLQAVLRHEAAHLSLGHQRMLTLAGGVEAAFVFFPSAARSAAALRTALERWADEVAAGAAPGARDQLRDAIVGVSGALVAPQVAALSAADTVVERVQALEHAPPAPSRLVRVAAYLPGSVLGGSILIAAGLWAGQARMVLAMLGRCPT